MREKRELFINSQVAILFKCLQGFEQRVFSLVAILGLVTQQVIVVVAVDGVFTCCYHYQCDGFFKRLFKVFTRFKVLL